MTLSETSGNPDHHTDPRIFKRIFNHHTNKPYLRYWNRRRSAPSEYYPLSEGHCRQ